MIEVLNKFFEFLTQNAGNFISAGAMLIAAISLWVTRKAFMESNRPYVTFNIEGELKPGFIFFYIRNTGIRGAQNVRINIKPKPKSYALAKFQEHKDRDEFNFTFLAPNQMIRTFFDHGVHRYSNNQKPDTEVFDITITYSYKKKPYKDVYKCDTSYLGYISDSSTPSDLSKGFDTIHKDLESISKALTRLDDNV